MNFSVTALLSSVDAFGTNFVSQAYQSLAQALTAGGTTSVAGLLLTLYLIFWGFGIWSGTASGGPAEHAFRLLRAFAIYALATGWGDFQVYVYSVMNDGPSAIGNSLLSTVSANATGASANLSTANGVQNALQNMWVTTSASVAAFIKNLGVLNVGGYVIGIVVYVTVALLIGFAVFLIILSKLFMWLLLALAPLFIVMLLFGFTARFFNGWLTLVVQYFFVQVLVYAFVAFFVSITQTYFDAVNQSATQFSTTWTEMAPLILIALIGFLLLTQITGVAAGLAGGMPIQALTPGQLFAPATGLLGAGGRAGGRALGRRYRDATGTLSRSERLDARSRARIGAGRDAYQETPEYKALAKKLSGTA